MNYAYQVTQHQSLLIVRISYQRGEKAVEWSQQILTTPDVNHWSWTAESAWDLIPGGPGQSLEIREARQQLQSEMDVIGREVFSEILAKHGTQDLEKVREHWGKVWEMAEAGVEAAELLNR